MSGGDGEAERDETKQDKMCKTPSGECVYKRVRRDEEGLQHLEVYTSEEVSHISCLPSPNIDVRVLRALNLSVVVFPNTPPVVVRGFSLFANGRGCSAVKLCTCKHTHRHRHS